MFLIVLHQLSDVTNKKIVLKKEGIDDILFNMKGSLSTLENFSGAVLNLIGAFCNMSLKSKWSSSDDEYISQKLVHYKSLASIRALFSLALIDNYYGNVDKFEGWVEVMAYNALKVFGVPVNNFEDRLQNLIEETHLEEIKKNSMVITIQDWIKAFSDKSFKPEIFYNQKTGYCLLRKCIPSDNPKFIKISKPGFIYDMTENDFIAHELFDLQRECWIKSRQRL